MTLEEALATIEFPQVDGLTTYFCETGEPYVSLVSGGVKAEGKDAPIFCSTEDIAVRFWLDAFNNYARDKSGVLYWRERPNLMDWDVQNVHCDIDIDRSTLYFVYSRLVISDRPAEWALDADSREFRRL
ncbi:hypothetical protein [Bradyrhizobium sp. dw_78]|uniref:hypothetical protein n=1 Tax=Bradyrhizobium sp. dw_78 TaxID=2719793 RepID=UPI001BD3A822|nr:hypothetical protein [Bradyrhizobium sp. dw_78]